MYSKTYGRMNLDKTIETIKEYINSDDSTTYDISIGTDSQNKNLTKVVVVVAVHRVGKGGIFFYDIRNTDKIKSIRQKIYYETALSLELAAKITMNFSNNGLVGEIEIHVDIGKKGKTSELITEITGWITSSGFKCKVKPEAYAASCIADKISK
jgi:uncharacterized protein